MDLEVARRLTGPRGRAALDLARELGRPDSLATATRMRAEVDAGLAAAALDQEAMRATAVAKVGPVGADMLWSRDGLEQATRGPVATWRAQRLAAAGIERVIDLGCGCGADARACLERGMEVSAVEVDPATAELARHNLPGATVVCADATEVAEELLAGADARTAVLLDPARRTGRGRSWRLSDLRPPWSFVADVMARVPTVVKLGPGVDPDVVPDHACLVHVGQGRDLVEASVWAGRWGEGRTALLVDDGSSLPGRTLPPAEGPLASYLAEPHPAAVRAGALGALAARTAELGVELASVREGIAYLTADAAPASPWLTWWRVDDVLDTALPVLRAWVRDHEIGTLEVKKRGIDVDPAALRRRLRPRGSRPATLVLTPTPEGARALVCTRVA